VNTPVYFLKLDTTGCRGELISPNFYWLIGPSKDAALNKLSSMPLTKVTVSAKVKSIHGLNVIKITLQNSQDTVALMAHVQLRNALGRRILPVYYSDNYISLVPGESRSITVTADPKGFAGQPPILAVDGWNITVAKIKQPGITIEANVDAQPDHSPFTGLPVQADR
jgi:hypothetical protein